MEGMPAMSLLKRLFASGAKDQARVRPLWHKVVEIAREPGWYAKGGIVDSVEGRFDAITLVLVTVMLRMERTELLRGLSARLTELFVDDMDGQLRQAGVGDLVVGKRMGKLMSVLGGRLDALRAALAESDDAALIAAIERNVTLTDKASPPAIAAELRVLAATLAALDDESLLDGRIAR
jgi:cytochrome b pre-mRNA-processing protein 3